MKCLSCGAENPGDKRFCSTCGEMLESGTVRAPTRIERDQVQHQHIRYVEPWPDMTTSKGGGLVCRLLGGIAWLMVSLGTFVIAVGWLGTIDTSGYGDPVGSLRLIGYGILMYAVAAIFFSIRAFEGPPR